jgi:hypothetical protein
MPQNINQYLIDSQRIRKLMTVCSQMSIVLTDVFTSVSSDRISSV